MRTKHVILVAFFVATVFGAGITQVGIEAARRETPHVLELFRRTPTKARLRTFETDLEDASWCVQRCRPWMQYQQFLALRDAGENALIGRNGWLFYRPGTQYLIEPAIDRDIVLSVITSFRDQLAARGIQLLVVPAPGKASIYPEMLSARATRHGAVSFRGHTRDLMDALADAGVAVADLFDVFAKTRADPLDGTPDLYLTQDTHWSPDGMRIAAHAVAERLLGLGWIAKGPVEYDVKPITVQRRGDVVRMLRVPRIEQRFGLEKVACAQVIRRDNGAPYEDDPDSDILVLGDSFLRIYQRDDPGSGGFIAHLARELGCPVASIVNDGGASTLVRQQLRRQPALLANKRVVVWEFVERDIRFGTEGWQDIALPPVAARRTAR